MKENPVQYLATVGRDGKAKCRPFMFALEQDGKLWFCTNNQKDVYKDMQNNPEIEISVSSPSYAWLRLHGKAVFEVFYLENPQFHDIEIPEDSGEQRQLLRALMNVRSPRECPPLFWQIQDAYLAEETKEKGIIRLEDLQEVQPGIYLWQGDITTLSCDAIMNAANSGMTGCYVPNHRCIDNFIHTYAGMQLRLDCARMMQGQGSPEPTGQAKITPAYNLPCRYILHTVGSIIQWKVTRTDRELLASCYRFCLELAAENSLESVAFCCISTGEFHFPNEEAAEIAINTVKEFLEKDSSVKKVIFNVYKDLDKEVYEKLLR